MLACLPRHLFTALFASLCAAAPLPAQTLQPAPLDVPNVPTNMPTVEAMLRVANVGPNDFVIDLGSGDGRILITAARLHGARGFGVDLDPQRVLGHPGTGNGTVARAGHGAPRPGRL